MNEQQIPRTVKEAVTQLLEGMSEEDKEAVKNTKKEELIKFHFGWGARIRSDFGLWNINEALLKDIGEDHPDSASMMIINAVWEELQQEI